MTQKQLAHGWEGSCRVPIVGAEPEEPAQESRELLVLRATLGWVSAGRRANHRARRNEVLLNYLDPKESGAELGRRLGISRQAVSNLQADLRAWLRVSGLRRS